MLRRSSILFICFLLFLALFALTAEGQDTYHIGIPQTLEDGSPNPAYKPNGQHEGNNYYFASLQSLKADIIRYSVIQQSGDSIELRLYSDQIIPNPSESADDFYHIGSEPSTPEYSTPKTVRITSGDGKPKDIKTSDGVPVDAGFLHIDSSVGTQKVNLIIDKNISIRAGSATEPDRYATHISGGDFIAQGVTYQEGGQIYVTNAGNNRSSVNLNGATFEKNTINPSSNGGAVLSLNNITSADLRNTQFISNDADWQVFVSNPTTIQLGATEEGTESVLGEVDGGGGIFLGGTNGSYTINIGGDGNFQQNQKIETNNGNYSLTVNKNGLGTWLVAAGITNQFHVQNFATMDINAGTLEMGNGSKIELHGNSAILSSNGNSILNMGNAAIFEIHGTNNATLHLSNNSTLNADIDSKIEIHGTNEASLNLDNSQLNLNNNTTVAIVGVDTNFEVANSTVTAGENVKFNIYGTGNTELNWNNSTIILEKGSVFDVQGTNVSLTMDGGTLEMGENVQYNARSFASGSNLVNLSNNNINMGQGARFVLTNDDPDDFSEVSLNGSKITLNGHNFIQTDQLSLYSTTFDIDAEVLKYAYDQNEPVLTLLDVSSIQAGNTVFDIHGIYSAVDHQELVQNTGAGTFNDANYSVRLDGVNINGTSNSRASAVISVDNNNQSLYLDVNFDNKILRWTGWANNPQWDLTTTNWRHEQQESSPGASDQYVLDSYIFSDAVVFDDFSDNKDYTINVLSSGVYISQQNGFLTDLVTQKQDLVPEYGMRVSGTKNWTFNRGSINDDFNPNPAESFEDQKKHVARLTFDGTGEIELNNDNANKFHDGLHIGNTDGKPIQLRVARPDSLGSGEYAGEITDIDTNTGGKYVVQHEGYGIKIVDNGANIQIAGGNTSTDDIMDQRILVESGSTGNIIINNRPAQETIVTASESYYKNKDNFDTKITHGGVIVVEDDASFTMTGNFHFKDNNNFAQEQGFDGGVLWAGAGADVTMSGNSYSNNAANNAGGAIYFSGEINPESEKKLDVMNSNFDSNNAKSGGAIYVHDNAILNFQNSAFRNNEAQLSGGAVYLNSDNATIYIYGASFSDNIAHGDDSQDGGQGGAIFAGGNKITIKGTQTAFENNIVGTSKTVSGKGGAIYLGDNGTLELTSSAFRNNHVNAENDSKGGAIYTGIESNIDLRNGLLESNSAYADGGAIYSVSGSGNTSIGILTIDGTRFLNNISETGSGGAIFTGDTIIHGNETIFSQNYAKSRGGALYVNHVNKETATINIKDSQFILNGILAKEEEDLIAFVQNGTTDNVDFTSDGGAVYLNATGFYKEKESSENYQLTLDVSGTQFLTNVAKRDGGAIYAQSYTTINANNTGSEDIQSTIFGNVYVDPENFDPDNIYGNVAGRDGGAIYINGEVNKKATSQLNVDGAIFQYNVAGFSSNGNGGAVYLHYADAEIANAEFYKNAAKGLGGGIYYENENGKELALENIQMSSNTAISGGAMYVVNPTTLHVTDSNFSENMVNQDGGAIYLKSNQSQLDIIGTQFANNVATRDGGAIRLSNNSSVNTNGATFSGNQANDGGAIGIDNLARLDITNTTFSENIATQKGGAIWINDSRVQSNSSNFEMNLLNIDSGTFNKNEAKNGGAIYAQNTTITSNSQGVTFNNNIASESGGALFAENSDLNLTNATFIENEAQKGGAIYFLTSNNQDREITLKTTANATNYFTGNKSNDNDNSIYFDVQGNDVTKISLNVETDGILYMNDPMSVNNSKQNLDTVVNLDLDIVKTGNGRWSLGGSNDFSKTKVGTTIDVQNGTFELQNGSELLLTNTNNPSDSFRLDGSATLATSGPVHPTVFSNLKTTSLEMIAGSKMKLDGNLALHIGKNYNIASILSGNGGLIKQDNKELKFTGATNNYNGNVTIEGGSFEIAKSGVEGSGSFVTKNGVFAMNPETVLNLSADLDQPSLVAKSVLIDRVHLNIGGISSSNNNQKDFILIHTTDGILGNFNTINGETETFTDSVDYLTFNLDFLNDRKDYGGTIGLRWYSQEDGIEASGRFTIEDNKYFNVGVALHDNKTNLSSGWSGTALDKYGLGTLELSATNTYSGKTTIHAGELLLTNKQGTGLGNAVVEVQKNARLGLNFDGVYNKTITGLGRVVQYGGTVELAGNNNYTGGTILKGGVTEFTAEDQFGTGTITLDGGTLRNKTETTLKRTIVVADNKNAQFDTPLFSNGFNNSLTFNGTISGKGGLEKTGDGILALTGKNTFTETAFVRSGGLKIDGSVQSDVRVQPYAAVSGSGNINNDLFISRNGYFDWYVSPNQSASSPLHVDGSVYLAEGAILRPRTDSTDLFRQSTNFANQITGLTILTYNKTLGGQFLAIDNTFNAFYDFELDYSVSGEIRVNGELLSHPRALGDVITTGLSIANRKLYRKAFTELFKETIYHKTVTRNTNDSIRGQTAQPTRSIWFTPMARANKFASTFVGGTYDFEAYGMQTGSTFWSSNNSSLGLMLGYERGSLRNTLDWIRSHDYQIGLYYGHIFRSGYEFRGFIGGGFQTFTASRNDMVETYTTKYDGSSFEINVEVGKLFANQNGTLFRPYIATDIEYSGQTAAQESEIGNAFRHYGRADLSQFFVRFGADVEKRLQFIDLNGGISYTGLLFGQTHAKAPIFYPTRGVGTTSYGARLGRSSITLKTGLNWHLNRQRTNTMFLDYFADIYLDRTGRVDENVLHSGNLGILVRY